MKVTKDYKPKFTKFSLIEVSNSKGKDVKWEAVESKGSVHIIAHNSDTDSYLFVKQLRPAVMLNSKIIQDGYVLELCAGLVDKDKSIDIIAKEEVIEELGYEISWVDFHETVVGSVGLIGQDHHIFSTSFNEDCKVSCGGGLDSEDIEIVLIKKEDLHKYSNKMDLITKYAINKYVLEFGDENI